jgi:Leucine-rich repeat (LRR) protein
MKIKFCLLFLALSFVFSIAEGAKGEGLVDSVPLFKDIAEGLVSPEKVFQLSLRGSKLKDFPMEVFQFKNLEYLDLSKNKLDSVPDQILSMKHLKVLKLAKNKFTSFPPVLYKMAGIKLLVISDNEIAYISPQIKNMLGLESLDLYRNNVSEIPSELGEIEGFKTLDLRGISMNKNQQAEIRERLNGVKIYMGPTCNCNM